MAADEERAADLVARQECASKEAVASEGVIPNIVLQHCLSLCSQLCMRVMSPSRRRFPVDNTCARILTHSRAVWHS
jgi:hypothetical protein